MLTISLTIGHNVKGLPHWTIEQVANTVSTRIEIAHVDSVEASRIRSLVPMLCTLLLQDAIMYNEYTCSVQFVTAQPVAA